MKLNILKELIKTEFKILEIREAPLEGFWEVVSEIGHERMIIDGLVKSQHHPSTGSG